MAEERCLLLENEITELKSELILLKAKFEALGVEKLAVEHELKVMRKKNADLQEHLVRQGGVADGIIDLTDEKVESDMSANAKSIQAADKLDDCEKKIDMDSNCPVSTHYYSDKGNEILESGPPITPCNVHKGEDGGILSDNKLENGSRIRKQLFREVGSPNKMMDPFTAGVRPASVCTIDIDDSECESETKLSKTENVMRKKSKMMISEQSDEEDIDGCKGSSPRSGTKRKRTYIIATSDSDSDDDDNKPISKFIYRPKEKCDIDSNLNSIPEEKVEEAITGCCRRRRLRKCESKDGPQKSSPSHCELNDKLERSSPDPSKLKTSKNESLANDDEENENIGENESEGEGESMNGFIVKSFEEAGSIADSDGGGDSVSGDIADKPGDVSDVISDYCNTMSMIQRKRNHSFKWEVEGEMLSCFGKDPQICMKAVCAVYRQQTADEKTCKATKHRNKRGFSQCDAPRGTELAKFLTNGNPEGDMVKSVEELEAHNPECVELCRVLAGRYSKQLFVIYKNKEDPYFLPP